EDRTLMWDAAIEEKVAKPLGLPLLEAAAAMFRLTNSLIHDLLHRTTVQRGLDPRRFSLFSFGGTAGMHVAAYGAELGVPTIVVPYSASVHGAYGLVTSDVAHEDQITSAMRAPADPGAVTAVFAALRERVVRQLHQDGFADDDIELTRSIDMRYRRQVHILATPVATSAETLTAGMLEATIESFERLYRQRYGEESAFREAGIELVSFRLRGTGRVGKPTARPGLVAASDASRARIGTVEAWVDARSRAEQVPGYDFDRLEPGGSLTGPAIVWTPITTLLVAPGQGLRVDEFRNIVIATNI
ncbi:MAG: hydantoinase/oxoprolinase family protein, partial [Gaiellales bacterium]